MKRIAILLALLAATAAGASTGTKFPNGVFRTTITDADLRKSHVTDLKENHGIYTMTLTPGHWTRLQKAPNVVVDAYFTGTYTVTGNRVHFRTKTPADLVGDDVWATWSFDGKALRFTHVKGDYSEESVLYDSHPWRKTA